MSSTPMNRRAGFSLPELLVSIVMLSFIMAAAVSFFRSQTTAFRRSSEQVDALQNARYAIGTVERALRTLGAGVSGQQPMLVYGGDSVIAFNTDYVEPDTATFRWAVYLNGNVPVSSTVAWDLSAAGVIPNTAYTYPPVTFRQSGAAAAPLSPAETMIFWFRRDSSTSRTDDYVLYQRTNAATPDVVSRNILSYPSRPFFQYVLRRRLTTGDTLITATGSLLPLIRRQLVSGITTTDSANYVRPDSVTAVRINLRVTNGQTGANERIRTISTLIDVPNNGIPLPSICGRAPLPPQNLTVTPDTIPGSGDFRITWTRSTDELSGEQDVWQYVVYMRPVAQTTFVDPLLILKKDTVSTYRVNVSGYTPGQQYVFGVSAQDCTPSQSSIPEQTATAP